MAYGLGVYNVAALASTTIGQFGTPVTMDAAYPLSNIKTRQVSKIAKTATDQNGMSLTFDNAAIGFGVNPIFAVLGLSTQQNDYTFDIRGSNVAMGNSELFFETGIVAQPSASTDPTRDEFNWGFFKRIVCATSARYVRIVITASATVSEPFQVGVVWIGPSVVSTERSDSLVGGLQLGGSNATSAGGQAHGAPAKSLRQCQVTIEKLLDTEKQEVMRALSYAGKGRPMVYMRTVSDSTSDQIIYKRDNSFYCHLEGEVAFTTQAARDLNTVTFGFVEER
jgi:hypothetical protein